MTIIYQRDVPVEKVIFDMVISCLNDWKDFEYEFENGDSLTIYQEDGSFVDIGEVRYLEVSYGDHSSNLGVVDTGDQYFAPSEVNRCIMVFLERLTSEDPSKETDEGRSLENIFYFNSKLPSVIYENNKPSDDDIKKLAIDSLRTHNKFIYVFKDRNILRISNMAATEIELRISDMVATEIENRDVDCVAITYAEYDQELSVDKDNVYEGITTEYFLKGDINLATDVFIEKINSEKPAFVTEKGKKLKDIRVFNTGVLSFDNHYDYLEVMLEPFWLLVFGKTPSEMWLGGVISAHGDKADGYEYIWRKANISFNRGTLLYLLTYTKELADTPKSKSGDWVIDKYQHYLPMIEEAEKQVLKDVYSVTS